MIHIVDSAEEEFVKLAGTNRISARQLALLLLDLENEPRPDRSHQLPSPAGFEDRVLDLPQWQITYRIGPEGITVAGLRMGGDLHH